VYKKIVIKDEYLHLKEFIEQIHQLFNRSGSVLHEGRNSIKVFDHKGELVVVKSFKKITSANRFIYTTLRKSKAQRSYEYALRFLENGFDTPRPIGWLDIVHNGLLKESYYISAFCDYAPLESALDRTLVNSPKGEVRTLHEIQPLEDFEIRLLQELAIFASKLHVKGVFHGDFNLTNILYHSSAREIKFSLIDNNRTKFRNNSYKRIVNNFKRLKIDECHFRLIAENYPGIPDSQRKKFFRDMLNTKIRFNRKRDNRRMLCKSGSYSGK